MSYFVLLDIEAQVNNHCFIRYLMIVIPLNISNCNIFLPAAANGKLKAYILIEFIVCLSTICCVQFVFSS